ncbi:MAG: TetR/AcrR family transcriptional regulator [Anaerolineaceae bacterium]|nr:TetR/AcrR family transcriptional regulator [Anaerolineaceae bacterium]
MPKLLPDIDQKIMDAAEELFREQGFEHTDMRAIARKTGIAVGTTYHYYKHKQALYQKVLARNWQKTNQALETLSRQSGKPDERLRKMLLVFIEDMQNRKAFRFIWNEIGKEHRHQSPHVYHAENFKGLHTQMAESFSRVIHSMDNTQYKSSKEIDRLGNFVFVMAVDICMLPMEEAAQGIEIILELIESFVKKNRK